MTSNQSAEWRGLTYEQFFKWVVPKVNFPIPDEAIERLEEFLHAAEKFKGDYAASLRKISKKLDKKVPSVTTLAESGEYSRQKDNQFAVVETSYPFTLISRRDGNCFYRCAFFGYLSALILKRNWQALVELLVHIALDSSDLQYRHNKLQQSWNATNLLTSMLLLFLYECIHLCLDEDAQVALSTIVQKYNSQPIVDAGLIIYVRNFIRKSVEEKEQQENDEFYITGDINSFGVEAVKEIYPFAAEGLNVKLVVQDLLDNTGEKIGEGAVFLPAKPRPDMETVTVCFTKITYGTVYSEPFTKEFLNEEKPFQDLDILEWNRKTESDDSDEMDELDKLDELDDDNDEGDIEIEGQEEILIEDQEDSKDQRVEQEHEEALQEEIQNPEDEQPQQQLLTQNSQKSEAEDEDDFEYIEDENGNVKKVKRALNSDPQSQQLQIQQTGDQKPKNSWLLWQITPVAKRFYYIPIALLALLFVWKRHWITAGLLNGQKKATRRL